MGYNDKMRDRTMKMSVQVYDLFKMRKLKFIEFTPVNQLIKSSSSVAANYNSATRGRSDAEFYSKICIVVEECSETQFWLRYMVHTGILEREKIISIYSEVTELLKMFTKTKQSMKLKLEKSKLKSK